MFESNKPHGLDWGRYTKWTRPSSPTPRPIQFLFCGITSGNYAVSTYEHNKLSIMDEVRKFVYHFFEMFYSAQVQADVYSSHADPIEPLVHALDWEEYRGYIYGEREANMLANLYEILENRYPRPIVYSNIDDFEILVKYVPEFASRCNLWIAYPPPPKSVNYEKTDWTDWPIYNEQRLKRSWSSVKFLQYSWWLDAQVYGAVNDKKEMDANVYQGTMEELDAWLGIHQGCSNLLKGVIENVKKLAN